MRGSDHDEWARQIASLPPKRLLLLCRELQSRLDAEQAARREPLAILGMGCRFPGGADDPETFWRLLRQGFDAVREVPADRWDVEAYYDPDPDAAGKMYSRWGGFLDQVDRFDAAFFNISPREAVGIDPQHRLLLEVTWEALEHAALAPDRLAGRRVGVFVGITANDYAQIAEAGDPARLNAHHLTGNPLNFAAGRLAYTFGFQGPCLAVDTACSSSLVALHLACQSLRLGECDLALAAGVNLILTPTGGIVTSRARMLSPDGRCKAFDAAADGMVRGEGCGVVVLARHREAVAHGDPVLALVLGSAVNQDGRGSGLTVPNPQAQEAVIREALERAGVKPAEVGYVEAHGTGTSLGDPIELRALAAALRPGRTRPFALGSVKTNLGHLESASGIAGLIKTVLTLRHGELAPHLHLRERTPRVDWSEIPAEIPTAPIPWPAVDRRIAGVSSFGGSGTNAHVVLAEALALPSPAAPAGEREKPPFLLTLSARSEAALRALAGRYAGFLARRPEVSLPDVCFTAQTGRAHLPFRLAATGGPAELSGALASYAAGGRAAGSLRTGKAPPQRPRVAWLFTGQGTQYPGMGRRLYESEPVFREALERCAELLRPHLSTPLLDALYPRSGETSPLGETAYAQPALFSLQHALAELWRSWGIAPAAVLGHSAGEYAAACAAGVLSLEDALDLVAQRGRLIQDLAGGGSMAAVFAAEERVREALAPYGDRLSIAALNAPQETTVAGDPEALGEVLEALRRTGVRARPLAAGHAFHSAAMDPVLDRFAAAAARVHPAAPRLSFVSGLTGRRLASDEVLGPEHWCRHLRAPVRFLEGMRTLAAEGCRVFLEIGPHPTLLALGRRCLDEEAVWLPSLQRGRDDREEILGSLGGLSTSGVEADWPSFHPAGRRRVALPTYPFQRERYWPEPPPVFRRGPGAEPSLADLVYAIRWEPAEARGTAALSRADPRPWLILCDRSGVGTALAERLEATGGTCLRLFRDGRKEEAEEGLGRLIAAGEGRDGGCRGIVHLWSLDARPPESGGEASLRDAWRSGCGSATSLLHALLRTPPAGAPALWLVTCGSQPVGEGTPAPAVAQAPLWGLGRVVALEHPDLWGGLADLDPAAAPEESAAALLGEILESDGEDQIAFRQGRRHVARLVRAGELLGGPDRLRLRPEAAYLITGGLGGVGLEIARHLVERGARHLVLTGRSGLAEPAAALPGSAARRRLETVRGLELQGATVRIVQGDIADPDAVTRLFKDLAGGPPLAGIVHAAGVGAPVRLADLDDEALEAVLRPKVLGSWLLHAATRDLDLDFFLLCSSAAAVWGSAGFAHYAAANCFLDALAWHRRSLGLPALSIDWGPWAGVGATGRAEEERLARRGVDALPPGRALALLERLAALPSPQVTVAQVRWDVFRPVYTARRRRPLLDGLGETAPRSDAAAGPAALPDGPRPEALRAYLRQRIAEALQAPGATVDEEAHILDLGLDSLMVMEVLGACRRDLGLELYPNDFFDHPTIVKMAEHLARELGGSQGLPRSGPARSGPPAAPLAAVDRETSPRLVFLLSSPRSGSTLLRVMLAGHPDLFCPPELHLLPYEDMAERRDALARGYLGEGLVRAVMELEGTDAAAAEASVAAWEAAGESIAAVYARLAALSRRRLLVDKSPSYASDPRTLARGEELFAEPLYVHLVRHPYAVLDSAVRGRMDRVLGVETSDPLGLAEEVWAVQNRTVLDFFRRIDPRRCHRVRYEDLVREPLPVMQRLCEFLGVPFAGAVLEPYEGPRMTDGIHPVSLPIGDPNFLRHDRIDPTLGEVWRQIRLPRELGSGARRLAAELGYELPGAEDPGRDRGGDAREAAGHLFQDWLRSHPAALAGRRLLESEGIGAETVRRFGLGYAVDRPGALAEALSARGFTAEDLREAGLDSVAGDPPRGRLLLPLSPCGHGGSPTGFLAWAPEGGAGEDAAWTGRTEGAAAVLPGLTQAREAIREEGYAIVVDSLPELLRAHQAGVRQVVTGLPPGSPLQPSQRALLQELAPSVFGSPRSGLSPGAAPPVTGLQGRFFLRSCDSRQVRERVDYGLLLPAAELPAGSGLPLLLYLPGAEGDLEPGLATLPDRMMAEGAISPMVVVVPRCRRGLFVDRWDGTANWEGFLLHELIPEVHASLDGLIDPRRSAVLGVSLGGLGALRLAFKHSGRFAAVAAVAAAVEPGSSFTETPRESVLAVLRPRPFLEEIFGRPVDADGAWTRNHPPALARLQAEEIRRCGLRISLQCGTRDTLAYDGTMFLHHVLEDLGIRHEHRFAEGARHDRAFFSWAVPQALRFLSGALEVAVSDAAG